MADEDLAGDDMAGDDVAGARQPLLRVVRGDPTPDELAALVAVLAARQRAAAAPEVDTRPRSQWRNRGRNIRPAIGPGPGAWRASGLPR
jgi:hypothetical protein